MYWFLTCIEPLMSPYIKMFTSIKGGPNDPIMTKSKEKLDNREFQQTSFKKWLLKNLSWKRRKIICNKQISLQMLSIGRSTYLH